MVKTLTTFPYYCWLEPKLVCQVQAPSLNAHAGNNSVFPRTITTI
jgi:hypothetical protein